MCHRCERVVAILKRSLCPERGWHNIYTIKTLDRQNISSCASLLPLVVSRRNFNFLLLVSEMVSVYIGLSFPLLFATSAVIGLDGWLVEKQQGKMMTLWRCDRAGVVGSWGWLANDETVRKITCL
jgi:hypothetical protein